MLLVDLPQLVNHINKKTRVAVRSLDMRNKHIVFCFVMDDTYLNRFQGITADVHIFIHAGNTVDDALS